ncbi:MAG: hypothetical protein JNM93_13175 [Bacteriovoracaceae bacterium]|nr:hypothetical protein [Bacteriovoracaceae bacterium]
MKKVILFIIILTVASCVKETKVVSDPSESNTTTTTTTTTAGVTTTTAGTPGSGTTCAGTSQDGDGSGAFPLMIRDVTLAGNYTGTNKEWIPVYYDSNNPNHNTPVPAGQQPYSDAVLLVNSVDATLRVRAKVLPQPSSCPFKKSGAESVPNYTKLRFKISMYALVPDPSISGKFLMVPTPHSYSPQAPVNVNSCSQIFDIPYKQSIQPAYANPVVIAVEDVRSDFECQIHGDSNNTVNCPAEKKVRDQSCWRVVLQVATDATDDFK